MSNIKSINQSSYHMKSSWRIFKKKKAVVNTLSGAIAALVVMSYSIASNAQLPTGQNVVGGNLTVSTVGDNMNITQTSNTGIIEWTGFNIGVNNTVEFANNLGYTLNRVIGGTASEINGMLKGSGSVYVINPHGLVVGQNGKIDVGGNFVGSTYNISNQDFTEGRRVFVGSDAGTVEILPGGQVKAGGNVALIGSDVLNRGTIEGGTVTLAAAGTNGSVALASTGSVNTISGNASALAMNDAGGTIRATGVSTENGRIYLRSSGDVNNAGLLKSESTVPNGSVVNIIAGNDVNLATTSNIDTTVHANGTGPSNVAIRAKRDVNLGGNINTDSNGIISISAADGNWQNGYGTVNGPASLRGKQISVLSGKTSDNDRADMDLNVSSTGGRFTTLALHGFDKIDTAKIASTSTTGEELMTEGGSLSLIGNDIIINESKAGGNHGDTIWIAAAFDDVSGDFETAGSGLSALAEADGWKTNTGFLSFINPLGGATDVMVCCHFIAKSGTIATDKVPVGFPVSYGRNDLTSADAVFKYSEDAANNVSSFRVEGFDTFDTTVENGLLDSSSYFIANNVNNKINYSINAGSPVGVGKNLNSYFTGIGGQIQILSGMFNTSNMVFDSALERIGTGTTQFADTPINLRADKEVIIVSGADENGARFDLGDNVQFGYTGTDNSYTQFKAVGFNDIALGTALLANNSLTSLGRFDLYAYDDIEVSGETYTGQNVLMIAHDDINIAGNSAINGTQTAVLVVDEVDPLGLTGNGALNLSADSEINGGQVGLYTRVQGDNNIDGKINGLDFVPGTEFVNSSQEQWETFYANGSNPVSPFKVYYKNSPPPPVTFTGNPGDCEQNPGDPDCIQALGIGETREFRTAQTDLTTRLTSDDDRLAEGQSNLVRKNEFQQVLTKNYVSSTNNSLNTSERLLAGVALPFTLVQQSLQGTQALASYVPIPGFEAILTLATKPLIAGVDILTPGSK